MLEAKLVPRGTDGLDSLGYILSGLLLYIIQRSKGCT